LINRLILLIRLKLFRKTAANPVVSVKAGIQIIIHWMLVQVRHDKKNIAAPLPAAVWFIQAAV
jgi:hypothetical protein